MLESLESRRLMSGNVTVTLDPTTHQASIVGDNKSNQVVIGFDGGGLSVQGTNGTTINGPTSLGFPSGIKVDMGNGDDSVRLDTGDPTLFVLLSIPVQVTTGNGNDTVFLKNFAFEDLNISTGNGDDQVELDNGTATFGNATVEVDTGNGADTITIDGLFTDNVTLDGGHGPDTLIGIGHITLLPGGSKTIIDVETIS